MKQSFHRLYSILTILCTLLAAFPSIAQDLTAREIVKKAHDKANGQTSQGTMKMTIVRPDWSREVAMKSWSKGTDYYLIYITEPVKDRGQVFMKREQDMWNWMPGINRMIKLPPSMMGQSWMGSDFTNDDLVRMNSIIDDFTHTIVGSEMIERFDCHIIELIPKPEAAVVWGKIKLWISKNDYYELKGEYYDEDLVLVNTMTSSNIKKMGDRTLPSRMVMVPVDKPGNQTILETIDIVFDKPIDESFFSQQNMKNIK
ncbi:MAG TPA: outer membrane lipoprotein-sorting protein [Bacteroidales bacterium]|nr:outer membrane lipoprotein-sorting protein [Bacteroidales bacterium]HPM91985.1 outer membrane lipoprotein-sorting protein [Bacteroidales bacterium]